jgi:NAD+ kinase
MNQIGIVFNPKVPEAEPLSNAIGRWLVGQHRRVWICEINDINELEPRASRLGLVIVLGGDGTTLAAARFTAPLGVPIFGVNLGRVGFLSESTAEAWQEELHQVLEGEYWLERRLMLEAKIWRESVQLTTMAALNDVVVSRGRQVRVVRFHLHVDGDRVTTYTADGLVIATPTGSTAYSMAAGGPLLPPQLQNFLVIPVAPHLSFERPVVLHQEAVVKIQVETEHGAIATADGQEAASLRDGDEVVIAKNSCDSVFARVHEPSYFYHRLMQRLSYWSRKQ